MIDPRNLQTVNQATLDRGWAWLDDHLDRLQDVALAGAGSDADREVQRKALMLVVSELYHRRSQRDNDGDTTSQPGHDEWDGSEYDDWDDEANELDGPGQDGVM